MDCVGGGGSGREGGGYEWLCNRGVRCVGFVLGGLFEMGNTYALGFGGSSGCVGMSVRHIAVTGQRFSKCICVVSKARRGGLAFLT